MAFVLALVFLKGGVLGALACNLLALAAKPLNLGLFANILTGLLVGGVCAVAMIDMTDFNLANALVAIAASLGAMTLIGLYLNHRAR